MNRITVSFLIVICLFVLTVLPFSVGATEQTGSTPSMAESSSVISTSSDVSTDSAPSDTGSSVTSDTSSNASSTESTPSDTSSESSSASSETSSAASSDASSSTPSDTSSDNATSSDTTASSDISTSSDTTTSSGTESQPDSDPEGGDVPSVVLPSADGFLVHFKDKKITVKAPEDAFESGVIMSVTELVDGNNFLIVKNVLSARADQFTAFRLAAANGEGLTAIPSSPIRLSITIPEGYDKSRVAILFITATGGVERVTFAFGEDKLTLDADVNNLGTYVIAELKPTENDATVSNPDSSSVNDGDQLTGARPDDNKKKEDPKWVSTFLLVASIVLLGGAAVAGIVVERLRLIK
ncbi:MAG: hypothetical protein J6S13_05145 [Clostridia bacterium]|nr:hypothetical protein [Clostridia bacterium]